MCYLTTVSGSFHGRVLAARLGAEGVIVVLRGGSEALNPGGAAVDVLVPAEQLKHAREILLADAVDDLFGSIDLSDLDASEAVAMPGWAIDAGVGGTSLAQAATASAPVFEEPEATAPGRPPARPARVVVTVICVALLLVAALGYVLALALSAAG
jgi:hypothetical protein